MILKCKCKNEYQDRKYGKQKRVHNPKSGGVRGGTGGAKEYRCTVCGAVRSAGP